MIELIEIATYAILITIIFYLVFEFILMLKNVIYWSNQKVVCYLCASENVSLNDCNRTEASFHCNDCGVDFEEGVIK